MTDTLTSIAIQASQEYYSEAEAQGDEMFEQHREEILSFARVKAMTVLGKYASALLAWEYVGTSDLPPDTNECRALIEGGPAYLRCRITEDGTTLELVRPCGACKQDRIDVVAHLAHLGSLLEVASDGR